MAVAITIRISDELHERIKTAATEDKRSRNSEMEVLLEVGLEARASENLRRAADA